MIKKKLNPKKNILSLIKLASSFSPEKKANLKHYYAYMRVSSIQQNFERQLAKFKQFEHDNNIRFQQIYQEKISGKDFNNQTQLQILLNQILRDGDCLVIESYSRLSRNFSHAALIMQDLNQRNILLYSLNEKAFYDSSPVGTFIRQVMVAMAQFERNEILERQRIGIQEAVRLGKFKGRQYVPVPPNFEICYQKYVQSNRLNPYTHKQFAIDTNLKTSTLISILREYKQYGKIRDERLKKRKT